MPDYLVSANGQVVARYSELDRAMDLFKQLAAAGQRPSIDWADDEDEED